VTISVDGASETLPLALKMILVLTALALAPAVLLTTTSFVRIAVVLSFLRNALGTQNMPPTQVVMGLALFLTAAVMAPVGHALYERALNPYLNGEMAGTDAIEAGSVPLRGFMLKQTRQEDLALFYEISNASPPKHPDGVAMHLLIPAFVISELRTAFEMGFMVFVPFLVIDLIVASILMALGMVMIPPSLVSLPLKIMLFVVADGWNVLIGSLVRSFV
jgi:flagellar biosynthesis protein FliP